MVLVSNEWQINKDAEQQQPIAAVVTTTTTAAAVITTTATATPAAAVAVTNGTSSVEAALEAAAAITEPPQTVRPGGEAQKRQQPLPQQQQNKHKQRHNKRKNQQRMEMESSKKYEQQELREKHETETRESPENHNSNSNNMNNDSNDNLENQENNNTTIAVAAAAAAAVADNCDSNTNTLQNQIAQQQVQLQLAINSVLNANNTNNLFGALNTLQMPTNENSAASATGAAAAGLLLNAQDIASNTGEARIVLQCEGKSHKFETRSILLAPNQECKVGRLIAKSKASEGNAIFDCKVLSRNHAMLWYTPDGRFWVKDTKSSNGTFINDNKLGNEPSELHYGDTVKFGVEVIENSRQEVHGCIIARVTLFLPDGREAISIDTEQLQLTGPNRISYEEIQRLNTFLQEASQREKMLKAKLSSLQGVLDTTRKNSSMCWQSMITEDQLLHKITLLEKKLQVMEKNVPENALRNEVVKLLGG
ncbi:transcription initiation factor TFIID subunit 1 isoform X1 [Drosophila busckii]|uniref:transcription initiation factor TFIID subunit 1 isoform X1 n=1 Tax=Drosophila busckii TaxID=30019 RepID=UPI001432CE23|nr:transcription initiation factor TFIID subunit 1 isoform X1 [Drosophila busckii]XP_033149336.1 transcription initiation factor TFIID subunit 1 isoform X1 [Drosophila busckii]